MKRATTIMEAEHYDKLMVMLDMEMVTFSKLSSDLIEDLVMFRDSNGHNMETFPSMRLHARSMKLPVTKFFQFLIKLGLSSLVSMSDHEAAVVFERLEGVNL